MNPVNVKSLQHLRNLSLFPLPPLERLAANLSVKQWKKNEIICDQDEPAALVYLLLSGVVRVSFINSHQRQTIVTLLPAGEFFGLDSLAPRARHPFRCEAFEASTIGSIRPQMFVEALLGVPYESFLRWRHIAMDPVRKMYIHCIKGIGLDLRKRLALELLNLSDRFGMADPRGVLIDVSISHEVLAGIVGASRQQVTEYLNEFDREKIISREGRRIIIDPQKLRRILELEH